MSEVSASPGPAGAIPSKQGYLARGMTVAVVRCMQTLLVSAVLLTLVVSWSGVAAAQAPPAQALPPVVQTMRWYGWQPLIIDASAGAALLIASQTVDADGRDLPLAPIGWMFFTVGAGGFVLGAPVAHAVHGHWATGGASLALRLGLPGLAFALARATEAEDEATLGVVALGMLTASVLDITLLSWERAPKRSLSLTPVVAWDGARSGTLGLAGKF